MYTAGFGEHAPLGACSPNMNASTVAERRARNTAGPFEVSARPLNLEESRIYEHWARLAFLDSGFDGELHQRLERYGEGPVGRARARLPRDRLTRIDQLSKERISSAESDHSEGGTTCGAGGRGGESGGAPATGGAPAAASAAAAAAAFLDSNSS